MTVDRGGRRENRLPDQRPGEHSQIELDIYRALPQQASRENVIRALVKVLFRVVEGKFPDVGGNTGTKS